MIISAPQTLLHSPMVEAEAFYRLKSYPGQIAASLHHAIITIPRTLAYVLHDCPSSIAPAVEAFYLRDPVALKSLQKTSAELIFSPDDVVTTSVRFTRVLYAQLKSQQFSAPVAWAKSLQDAEKAATDPAKTNAHTRLELGMKVASGFEMLISDTAARDQKAVREMKLLLGDLEEGGVELPTNSEIATWIGSVREDDESWLDIDFNDFEKELQGKSGSSKSKSQDDKPTGFGDAKTQADLKKMVERFESFLNDDKAGPDGAQMDDMDFDDDEDSDGEEDSEDEDKEVSFDEIEFAKMMREMMGMPSNDLADVLETAPGGKGTKWNTERLVEKLDSDDDIEEDEVEDIRKVMRGMEAELTAAGALNLDPPSSKVSALRDNKVDKLAKKGGDGQSNNYAENQDWKSDTEDEGDVDIDFNLAKNLLESFKSQAGMAGPGGNLMGLMGIGLPRDEDDAQPKAGEYGKRL